LRSLGSIAGVAAGLALAGAAAENYTFDYTYPAAAARIAPLRAFLEAEKASLRRRVARDAADARTEAAKDNYPYRSYEVSKDWQVVTETPAFLSLSSQLYSFSGGAHGNTGSGALLWDKARRMRMEPKALFNSPTAFYAAVRSTYCKALDAERAKRIGRPVDKTDSVFGGCPRIGELTLLLGSSNRKKFDRIALIADQYVAGSYAEGPYEITLPVTPAVVSAVKPTYRSAFAVKR